VRGPLTRSGIKLSQLSPYNSKRELTVLVLSGLYLYLSLVLQVLLLTKYSSNLSEICGAETE